MKAHTKKMGLAGILLTLSWCPFLCPWTIYSIESAFIAFLVLIWFVVNIIGLVVFCAYSAQRFGPPISKKVVHWYIRERSIYREGKPTYMKKYFDVATWFNTDDPIKEKK